MIRSRLASILLFAFSLCGCGDGNNDLVVSNQQPGPPVATHDSYSTRLDVPLIVLSDRGVLVNDKPQGNIPNFQALSANGGQVVGSSDGSFTYTPPQNFVGTDTFSYTLGDVTGGRSGNVSIIVAPTRDSSKTFLLLKTVRQDQTRLDFENNIMNSVGPTQLVADDSSRLTCFVKGNTFRPSAPNISGASFEAKSDDFGSVCLDLEDNIDNGDYHFSSEFGRIRVEQFTSLTQWKPSGAGNTGRVTVDSSRLFHTRPISVGNGFCERLFL